MEVKTPDPPRLPKRVPAQIPPDFTFPNKDTPKTHPVLYPNLWRGTFGGVCNTPLHGYVQNLAGFIFPHTDAPKTHPILAPNHRRGVFGGVCNMPLHRYMKNLSGFRRKPSARDISGRMLLRPYTGTCKTRPVSYFAHGYAKNVPGFTLPNRDTPKNRPVLGLNLRRGSFGGVCNTPLHGYMKN